MSSLIREAVDFLIKNWGVIFSFLLSIVKRRTYAIVLFLVFSGGAVISGFLFFKLSEQYNTIFSGLLKTSTEPTPQEFKGVESFILSVANNNQELTTGLLNIKQGIINDRFINELNNMKEELKSEQQQVQKPSQLTLVSGTEILTDDCKVGFLFLPIYLLNNTIKKVELDNYANGSDLEKNKIITTWFEKENGLLQEIALTRRLAKSLDKVSKTNVIRPESGITTTPKQVYFITKNGINRIFSKNHADLSDYYGQHFQARTFFPSRPYFWPTFDHDKVSYTWEDLIPKHNARVEEYFHVTQPYLDLAWNGFVITLTRGIHIDGEIQGVLCIDIPLPLPFSVSLEKSLEKVAARTAGVSTHKLSFNFDQREVRLEQESANIVYQSESLTQLWNDFRTYISENSERKADLLGNILVFNGNQKGEKIEIFVQSGDLTGSQRSGAIGLNGLFISIDIRALKRQLHTYALFFVVFIVFAFLTVTGLYVNTFLIHQELEHAFTNVGLLMDKLPLPYVRLDGNDNIVDYNDSFCIALKLPDDFNKPKARSFRSFCASRSDEKIYDEIQFKRKNDQIVEPYRIDLKRQNKKPKSYFVVSGKFPSSKKGLVPDTFGVLLKADSERDLAFLDKHKII